MGGSGVETILIATELGRLLCLEPYLHSLIFAGGLISQLGNEKQKNQLLPQVASAKLQLAVALDEPLCHYSLHDVKTRAEAVATSPDHRKTIRHLTRLALALHAGGVPFRSDLDPLRRVVSIRGVGEVLAPREQTEHL